jgi:ABC-type amino acid transport substrate-binding protein
MIRRWFRGLARFLAAAALLFLGNSGPALSQPPSDLAAVKARGKLIMLTYPVQGTHFIAVDLDTARQAGLTLAELHRPEHFRGIDVDLMSGFAKSLGVELEIRSVVGGYGALLPALEQQRGDLVASEFTITPERLARADFTQPYVANWVAVAVRRDSAISSPADLRGKIGAALSGSSQIEFLKAAAPGARIKPTQFDLESLAAVEEGSADFALMDSNTQPGETVDALHPGLKVSFRLHEVGDGIAVRKQSDLLPALNAYLTALRQSGELQRILERHLFRKPSQP